MQDEKMQILCSVCYVSPEEITKSCDEGRYYIKGERYYVVTSAINNTYDYDFIAEIGPYKVYREKSCVV